MVIDTHTEIYDLLREYERTCVTITFKDGTSKKIFFLDVDDEYQENDVRPEKDCIVYNITDSISYGNGIPLDKLRSSPKCWCKLNSASLSFHKLKHTGFF
ncbi:hypothetical protein BUW47_10305 [Limosilactobacillus fermentum]|uniref:Uncharacterized protein n=2 Tax=Limosilactobacillus fermentum TaxID=1613 RepID=A0A1L7GY86_LIMFE|nr:hypothetical protein BUW47_10305 [Limosilactobacillus fermentum]